MDGAVSYDADLFMPESEHYRCSNAVVNMLIVRREGKLERRYTYRCRLRGIRSNKNRYDDNAYKNSRCDVWNFLSRCDFKVCCVVDEIDRYRRVLIDIIDPETGVFLKHLLLRKYPELFFPFEGHRNDCSLVSHFPAVPEDKLELLHDQTLEQFSLARLCYCPELRRIRRSFSYEEPREDHEVLEQEPKTEESP